MSLLRDFLRKPYIAVQDYRADTHYALCGGLLAAVGGDAAPVGVGGEWRPGWDFPRFLSPSSPIKPKHTAILILKVNSAFVEVIAVEWLWECRTSVIFLLPGMPLRIAP